MKDQADGLRVGFPNAMSAIILTEQFAVCYILTAVEGLEKRDVPDGAELPFAYVFSLYPGLAIAYNM